MHAYTIGVGRRLATLNFVVVADRAQEDPARSERSQKLPEGSPEVVVGEQMRGQRAESPELPEARSGFRCRTPHPESVRPGAETEPALPRSGRRARRLAAPCSHPNFEDQMVIGRQVVIELLGPAVLLAQDWGSVSSGVVPPVKVTCGLRTRSRQRRKDSRACFRLNIT